MRTPTEKLFFILFYYKCYPTFDVSGLLFDLDRSNACRNVRELTLIAENVLEMKMVLPERKISTVEGLLELFPPAGVFPKSIALWLDLGFTGVARDYPAARVMMPKKKPKGRELTDAEKARNKAIRGFRVWVEHAICDLKRFGSG